MSRGSLDKPSSKQIFETTLQRHMPLELQPDLFPLRTQIEYTNSTTTADAICRVQAADSHDYIVKSDDRGGQGVCASEWLGTHLAEELNMPCPTPKVVQMNDGELCFGSRIITGTADNAVTTAILTSVSVGTGAGPILGLSALLSALYAFDMFIHNVDRHDQNYLSVDDRGTRRFYAIDFGRSLFWNGSLSGFPTAPQPTVTTFRQIVVRHGFDLAAALAVVERLSELGVAKIEAAFSTMPASWLDQTKRREFISWWKDNGRHERLQKLREGLTNGTLL